MQNSIDTKSNSATDSSAIIEPVESFWRLCRQGQHPDPRAFLDARGKVSPLQALAVLRLDQHERWSGGDPISAETYLTAYPEISDDLEVESRSGAVV